MTKVILSRKGFDKTFGGGPSPIVDGLTLVSLPIEYGGRETVRRFADLQFEGQNLGELVERLYRSKRNRNDFCHLDPDLVRGSLPDRSADPKWRPLFGQADSAARHLIMKHVGEGDIFLFFGLFRASDGWSRFRTGAPEMHVIHSWLQVDKVIHDPVGWAQEKGNEWAMGHPHTYGHWWKHTNILFVGKKQLEFERGNGRAASQLPGAGTFRVFDQRLVLSDPAKAPNVSKWRLPRFLQPDANLDRTISYIGNGEWRPDEHDNYVYLDPGKTTLWQEAVIENNPEAVSWATDLIAWASDETVAH